MVTKKTEEKLVLALFVLSCMRCQSEIIMSADAGLLHNGGSNGYMPSNTVIETKSMCTLGKFYDETLGFSARKKLCGHIS